MQIESFVNKLDSVGEWSGRAAMGLIIPLAVIVVFEVISRRLFNSPHVWVPELMSSFYGSHFMLVAAYALLHKDHVKVDVIYEYFSPRGRGVLDILSHLIFFFPFCIVLLVKGIDYAQTAWILHERSQTAAMVGVIPVVKTVIPVTFALLLIQGFAQFIRSVILATTGKEM